MKTKMFTAKGCAPCQVVKRMLNTNPQIAKHVEVIDIDTDEGDKAGRAHRIAGTVPTFVREDGKRRVGSMNKREMVAWLKLEEKTP